jgi:CheY-like chemotaxis protein
MDINMPEMNGYETTQKIREFNTNVPVIALTAFSKNDILSKAIQSGINEVVEKPFETQKLYNTMDKLVSSTKVV